MTNLPFIPAYYYHLSMLKSYQKATMHPKQAMDEKKDALQSQGS